jgi:probable HAF family extracellular repeat protein
VTHVLDCGSSRHRRMLILGLVALAACSDSSPTTTAPDSGPALAAAGKSPAVQMTDLGGLTDGQSFANAVNASGVIVGAAQTARSNGVVHAARWRVVNGKPVLEDLTTLLQLPSTHASVARGINDQGSTAGWRLPPNAPPDATDAHAFLLMTSGELIDLHASPLCSGESDGKNWSRAYDVNNLGEVVGGRSNNPNPTGTSGRAFYWVAGCMIELPTLGIWGSATAINDNSVIVGESMDGANVVWAVRWQRVGNEWTISKLGRDSTSVNAISDFGTAVGEYRVPGSGVGSLPDRHALSWPSAGGERELGTLGGLQSVATGIDGSGRIVGWSHNKTQIMRAFDWTASQGMRDLGSLGRGTVSIARAIHGKFIVGESDLDGTGRDPIITHATLWTLP